MYIHVTVQVVNMYMYECTILLHVVEEFRIGNYVHTLKAMVYSKGYTNIHTCTYQGDFSRSMWLPEWHHIQLSLLVHPLQVEKTKDGL